MTPHAAPPEAHREVAITRKAPTTSDPPWRGHWLRIARAGWLLLAVAELGLFTVALPARYAQLAAPDQAVRAELAVLGLSPGMYAFYQVALDTIFDLTLPLDQVAEGYAAMDEFGAIKTLLRP